MRSRVVPWMTLVFGVIGVVGVIFTVVTYIVNRPVYELQGILISEGTYTSQAFSFDDSHSIELQILFDGEQVEDLAYLQLGVRNSGNRPLIASDIESLYLQFPPGTQLLAVELVDYPDEAEVGATVDPSTSRITMSFVLLKPQEIISLGVYIAEALPPESVEVGGRTIASLANSGRLQRLADLLSPRTVGWPILLIAGLLVVILSTAIFFLRSMLSRPVLRTPAGEEFTLSHVTTSVEDGSEEGRITILLDEPADRLSFPALFERKFLFVPMLDIHRSALPDGLDIDDIQVGWTSTTKGFHVLLGTYQGQLPAGRYILTYEAKPRTDLPQ